MREKRICWIVIQNNFIRGENVENMLNAYENHYKVVILSGKLDFIWATSFQVGDEKDDAMDAASALLVHLLELKVP